MRGLDVPGCIETHVIGMSPSSGRRTRTVRLGMGVGSSSWFLESVGEVVVMARGGREERMSSSIGSRACCWLPI